MGLKKPNIRYEPGKIKGSINIKKKSTLEKPASDEGGKFSDENEEIIQEVLSQLDRIANKIVKAQDIIDKELKDYKIPYNPKEQPLLDEAIHCPICGSQNAQCHIDIESDRLKDVAENKINNIMAQSFGPSNGSLNPKQVSSQQQKSWLDMLSKIIDELIKTIVSTILEALNSILGKIPGVGSLLKAAKKKYKTKKMSVKLDNNIENFYQNENDNSSLIKLNFDCVTHISNYRKFSNALRQSQESEKENIVTTSRALDEYKSSFNSCAVGLAALFIPNGKEYENENGEIKQFGKEKWKDKIKSKNELNIKIDVLFEKKVESEGLNATDIAKKDSKYRQFLNKLENSIDNAVLNSLNDWWKDPATVCCLVKIFLDIKSVNPDFFKWLKYIKTILRLREIVFKIDFNLQLSRISDFIKTLLDTVVKSILNSLSSMASISLNAANAVIIDALGSLPRDVCLPLDRLVDYTISSVRNLKNELTSMIDGLLSKNIDLFFKLDDIVYQNTYSRELKGFIQLLDIILDYDVFIDSCKNVEPYKSKYEGESQYYKTGGYQKEIGNIYKRNKVVNYISNNEFDIEKIKQIEGDILENILKSNVQYKYSTTNLKSIVKDCNCSESLTKKDLERLKEILKKY